MMRFLGLRSLRYPKKSFLHFKRLTNSKNNVKFAEQMELFDTSIPTMEKILTILQHAESNKEQSAVIKNKDPVTQHEEISLSQTKSHSMLGLKVLDYNLIRILNDAEVVEKYKSFINVSPESCEVILNNHAETLRESLLWLSDISVLSNLGESFRKDPVRMSNELRPKLREIAAQSLVDFEKVEQKPKFTYDIPEIRLPNPFRGSIEHPMIIRKGLSLKKRPLNLLCFLLDNKCFLESFFGKLRSALLPALLLNVMKCQSLEGSRAFKVLLEKHLKSPESNHFRLNPIDSFGKASVDDLEGEMTALKAIVAHKSKLLTRLDSFGIYKDSLAEVNSDSVRSSEDVVRILAGSFDRYFGACYRLDAKGCDEWVERLISFYKESSSEMQLIEELYLESINSFRDQISQATLRKFLTTWSLTKHKQQKNSKKARPQTLRSS